MLIFCRGLGCRCGSLLGHIVVGLNYKEVSSVQVPECHGTRIAVGREGILPTPTFSFLFYFLFLFFRPSFFLSLLYPFDSPFPLPHTLSSPLLFSFFPLFSFFTSSPFLSLPSFYHTFPLCFFPFFHLFFLILFPLILLSSPPPSVVPPFLRVFHFMLMASSPFRWLVPKWLGRGSPSVIWFIVSSFRW